MVANHKKDNVHFPDVAKKFKTEAEGTSCLVRDVNCHTISITYRKKDSKDAINLINVSNDVRDKFFRDAKKSTIYSISKKYKISILDEELYRYWSDFMNNSYLSTYNAYKIIKELEKGRGK